MPMTPEEAARLERLERIVFGLLERYGEQLDPTQALHEARAIYQEDHPGEVRLLALDVEPNLRGNDPVDDDLRSARSADRANRANNRAAKALSGGR